MYIFFYFSDIFNNNPLDLPTKEAQMKEQLSPLLSSMDGRILSALLTRQKENSSPLIGSQYNGQLSYWL
jgi:hypothetical protein